MRAGSPNELAKLLYTELSRGTALSDAVAALPNVPQVLPAAIRAGERTSNLVNALDDYLRFDDLVSHLKSKIINSAIYPSIVAGLGFVISVFLLLVVLPSFSRMYLSIRGNVSPSAALMMSLSRFSAEYKFEITLTAFFASGRLGVCPLERRAPGLDSPTCFEKPHAGRPDSGLPSGHDVSSIGAAAARRVSHDPVSFHRCSSGHL